VPLQLALAVQLARQISLQHLFLLFAWYAWYRVGGMAYSGSDEVTLRRAALVLGWLTACGRLNHLGTCVTIRL